MQEFDPEQKKQLSARVVEVLGDRILNLTKPQESALEHALYRVLLANKGQASSVTDDEIEGAWEMMEEVWPDVFNQHYLNLKEQT